MQYVEHLKNEYEEKQFTPNYNTAEPLNENPSFNKGGQQWPKRSVSKSPSGSMYRDKSPLNPGMPSSKSSNNLLRGRMEIKAM